MPQQRSESKAERATSSSRGVERAGSARDAARSELAAASLEDKLVQLRAAVGSALRPEQVQAIAAAGVGSGGGGALPHGELIQRAFGRHDVSDIKAQAGGAGADACAALGAHGFALGDKVALRSSSDLFTAAHEAAHVVQQRHGAAPTGGVGQAGDRHERHADRVAQQVVRGESAEGLLDEVAGGAARRGGAVQLNPDRSMPDGTTSDGAMTYAPDAADPPSAFANTFNTEFRSVLHAFTQESSAPSASGRDGASGPPVSDVVLRALFTSGQRAKLARFCRDHTIPERLFNGDDTGSATAQQRILMSGHILAVGRYRPGSEEQVVHARMCNHWSRLVHHYAGVARAGGAGSEGNLDHDGNAVLGGARLDPAGTYNGRRTYADQLPDEEQAGGVGPRHGSHANANGRTFRQQAYPIARFSEIQPGDWIYYYTAVQTQGGNHSVIFSRWTSETQSENGVHFRHAVCFSQRNNRDPNQGGDEHTVLLGDQFAQVRRQQVHPIVYVRRVEPEAGPATNEDELLPDRANRRVDTDNEEVIRGVERRHPGQHVDREQLFDQIRRRNTALIAGLDTRRTEPGQRAMLSRANDDPAAPLQTLIRLNERLRELDTAIVGHREAQAVHGARVDAERAAEGPALEAQIDELDGELRETDEELGPIEAAIDRLDAANEQLAATRRRAIDELRTVRAELPERRQAVSRLARRLRGHPEREAELRPQLVEQQALVARLRQRIATLQTDLGIAQRERGLVRRARGPEVRARNRLRWRRSAQQEARDDVSDNLPAQTAQPGGSDVFRGVGRSTRVTGRLTNLSPPPDWNAVLAPGDPLPTARPRRRRQANVQRGSARPRQRARS